MADEEKEKTFFSIVGLWFTIVGNCDVIVRKRLQQIKHEVNIVFL